MLSCWGEQFLLSYREKKHWNFSLNLSRSLIHSLPLPLSFSMMRKKIGWKIRKLLDEFTNSISKILFNKWILIGLSMLCFFYTAPFYISVIIHFTPGSNAACCQPDDFFPCMRAYYSVCECINVYRFIVIIIIIWQKEFYKVIIQSIIIFNIYR